MKRLSMSVNNKTGLYTSLASDAGGRRSGDQFCVYVADRMVLPTLTREQISDIPSGATKYDALIRTFIHHNLTFRFFETKDRSEAYAIEDLIRKGALKAGTPLLNPI